MLCSSCSAVAEARAAEEELSKQAERLVQVLHIICSGCGKLVDGLAVQGLVRSKLRQLEELGLLADVTSVADVDTADVLDSRRRKGKARWDTTE